MSAFEGLIGEIGFAVVHVVRIARRRLFPWRILLGHALLRRTLRGCVLRGYTLLGCILLRRAGRKGFLGRLWGGQ